MDVRKEGQQSSKFVSLIDKIAGLLNDGETPWIDLLSDRTVDIYCLIFNTLFKEIEKLGRICKRGKKYIWCSGSSGGNDNKSHDRATVRLSHLQTCMSILHLSETKKKNKNKKELNLSRNHVT